MRNDRWEFETTMSTEGCPALDKFVDEPGDDLDVVVTGVIQPAEPDVGISMPYVEDLEVETKSGKSVTELLNKKLTEELEGKLVDDFLNCLDDGGDY